MTNQTNKLWIQRQ